MGTGAGLMAKTDDGGPAFPRTKYSHFNEQPIGCSEGMSLRDYFAGQALAGHLASFSGENVGCPPAERSAQWAYEYADAMLAEREK